ncbi:RCC1 domain-containing protein [Streptomyces sp. NPDC048717]|uniref:RCC1-like domain-containing protein n=1 Tax=Streptomyces sp. NPDC048717 TaxID=3154928 RepID=UPI00343EE3B7
MNAPQRRRPRQWGLPYDRRHIPVRLYPLRPAHHPHRTQRHPPHTLLVGLTVEGGFAHSVALTSDGSVYAWGVNGFG